MTLAKERLMLTIALFCPSTGRGGGTIDPWYPGSKETLSHLISSEIDHMPFWVFIILKYTGFIITVIDIVASFVHANTKATGTGELIVLARAEGQYCGVLLSVAAMVSIDSPVMFPNHQAGHF